MGDSVLLHIGVGGCGGLGGGGENGKSRSHIASIASPSGITSTKRRKKEAKHKPIYLESALRGNSVLEVLVFSGTQEEMDFLLAPTAHNRSCFDHLLLCRFPENAKDAVRPDLNQKN